MLLNVFTCFYEDPTKQVYCGEPLQARKEATQLKSLWILIFLQMAFHPLPRRGLDHGVYAIPMLRGCDPPRAAKAGVYSYTDDVRKK